MLTQKRMVALSLIGVLFVMVKVWEEAKQPGWFPLKEVRLLGVRHTQVAQSVAVMGAKKGINLLAIDLEEARRHMETLPWVRSARVKRQFPSVLTIHIVEKVAVATGRAKDRIVLLDEYGMVIKPLEPGDPVVAPIIVPARGEDPAAQVVWLVNLLAQHAWLQTRISEAVGLPGGRWTLYTRKGIKLLFSNRTEQELQRLKQLQDRHAILDRKVRQVELRIPGKAAIRFSL